MPLPNQAILERATKILSGYELAPGKRRGALYLLEKALGAGSNLELSKYAKAFDVWVSEKPDSQVAPPPTENISLGIIETKPEGEAVLNSVKALRKKHPDQKVGITYVQKPGGFEVVVEGPQDLLREFHLEYRGARLESVRAELAAKEKAISEKDSELKSCDKEISQREKDFQEVGMQRDRKIFFISSKDAGSLDLKKDVDYRIAKLKTGENVLVPLNVDTWDLLKSYENKIVAQEDARLGRIEQELLEKGKNFGAIRNKLEAHARGLEEEREKLSKRKARVGEDENFLAGWAEKLKGKKERLAEKRRKYELDVGALAQAEDEFSKKEYGLYLKEEEVRAESERLVDSEMRLTAVAKDLTARDETLEKKKEMLNDYRKSLTEKTRKGREWIKYWTNYFSDYGKQLNKINAGQQETARELKTREGELKAKQERIEKMFRVKSGVLGRKRNALDEREVKLKKEESDYAERDKELRAWYEETQKWKSEADGWSDDYDLRVRRVAEAEANLKGIGDALLLREEEADFGRRAMPGYKILKGMAEKGKFNPHTAVAYVRHLLGMPRAVKKKTPDYAKEAAFYKRVGELSKSARNEARLRARIIQVELERLPNYLKDEVFGRYPHLELDVLNQGMAGELSVYFAELRNLGEMAPVEREEFLEVSGKMPEPHRNRIRVAASIEGEMATFPKKIPTATIEAYSFAQKEITPAEASPTESRVPREPEPADSGRVVIASRDGIPRQGEPEIVEMEVVPGVRKVKRISMVPEAPPSPPGGKKQ